MELLKKVLDGIAVFAIVGAFYIPNWIAGVNKAMRWGRAPYPKEQRIKKWKWVGIFVLTGLVAIGLYFLLDTFAS